LALASINLAALICLGIGGCIYMENISKAKLIEAKANAQVIEKSLNLGLTTNNVSDIVSEE
jgi:hypothetical protein